MEDLLQTLDVSMGSLSRIERGEQWPNPLLIKRVIEMTDGEIAANDFFNSLKLIEAAK